MSVLSQIVADTRVAVARRAAARPLEAVAQDAGESAHAAERRSLPDALALPGVSLIAEHKRRSPSAGAIREGVSLRAVVTAYERAGARALSVLTEESRFGGSLADLQAARAASRLPILRKDFIVDPYQVHEARAAGADAILLIVAALGADELGELLTLAGTLGLDALVEVHDRRELDVAANAGAEVIGINNRDLTTLEVDLGRALQLHGHVPAGTLVVAESGYRTRAELDELQAAGIDGVLIGEALMHAPDIEAACRALTGF
ncbi:MAG: indole-3-glycerol phosphate synthase TrpC [Solirubrobacteraceae bacterium]